MKRKVIFRTILMVLLLNFFTVLAIDFYNPPHCLVTSPYPEGDSQAEIDLSKECYCYWNGEWVFVGHEWNCSGMGEGCHETYCDLSNPYCKDTP